MKHSSNIIPPFLVAGPAFVGLVRCDRDGGLVLHLIDQGRGPYYGITWDERRLFLLDRNHGRGELIRVVSPEVRSDCVVEIGKNIDAHQILFHSGFLWVTATRENALVRVDVDGITHSRMNWSDSDTDVNHINGISPRGRDGFWVSHDNKTGNVSEIVSLTIDGHVLYRYAMPSPHFGTHNIEQGLVVGSGSTSVIWQFDPSASEYPVLWSQPGRFFRGLAFARISTSEQVVLIGTSPLLQRSERTDPHTGSVFVCSREPFRALYRIDIPGIGQVHEVRTIGLTDSHNGIPCPDWLRDFDGGEKVILPTPTPLSELPD